MDVMGVTNTFGTLCLVAILASCGGGDGWTSEDVELSVRASMEQRITEIDQAGRLDSLDCVKRDSNEFRCLAEVSASDGAATLTATVTCEVDCIWALDNYALKP